MTPIILKKFLNFIYYPDLACKQMINHKYDITQLRNFYVDIKYNFNNFNSYAATGLKLIYTLESVYPRRPLAATKTIRLSYKERDTTPRWCYV